MKGYDAAHEHLLDVARTKQKQKVEKKWLAVIVTGPPASGKSSIAREIALRIGAAIPDPDDAKEILPEYRGGIGASAVHAESLRLYDRVLDELTANGENVVVPTVGHTAQWTRDLARDLKEAGYSVSLVNMTVEPDEAYRRMVRRFAENGRLVDHDHVASVGNRPRDNYYQLKTEGIFDQAADFDANGPDLRLLDGQNAYGIQGFRMVR